MSYASHILGSLQHKTLNFGGQAGNVTLFKLHRGFGFVLGDCLNIGFGNKAMNDNKLLREGFKIKKD